MTTLLAVDESGGLQNTTQGTVTSNDTGQSLPERFQNVLALEPGVVGTPTSTALSGVDGVNTTGTPVVTFTGQVTDVGFNDPAGNPYDGDLSGLLTSDGHAIGLYTSTFDNNVLLGKDLVTGEVVFAAYLDTGVASADGTDAGATSAKLWLVQFGALRHPDTSTPDDIVFLSAALNLHVDTALNFSLAGAPAGQNLFLMFGDGTPAAGEVAIIVTGGNLGDSVNSGQGGGTTSLGTNNQMIDAGKALNFTFVKGANPDYTVPNLSQNEADVAANLQFDTFHSVRSASFMIAQTQPASEEASLKISAFNNTDADEKGSLFLAGVGDADDLPVNITEVVVLRDGVTYLFSESSNTVQAGITASFAGDTLTLVGLADDDKVTYTASSDHNRLRIQNIGSPVASDDNNAAFDIGALQITSQTVATQALGDIAFVDDGPLASLALTTATAVLDESTGAMAGDGNAEADDLPPASDPFAGAYGAPVGAVVGVQLVDPVTGAGADGGGAMTLSLVIVGGSATGLTTSAGAAIELFAESTQVVTGRAGGSGGTVVFAIRIDDQGLVDVAQYIALAHPEGADPDDVLDLAGKLNAVVTQTDSEGDSASDAVAIGAAIQFEDDGPTASANAGVQLDDDALAAGNPGSAGSDDDPDGVHLTGTLGHDFGADGGGTVAWLETGAPAGFAYDISGTTLAIIQGSTVVMTLYLDAETGTYGITQIASILHTAGDGENNTQFAVAYRVTDADGDTADGTLAIDVDDDTPTASIVRTAHAAVLDESAGAMAGDGNAQDDDVPPASDPFAGGYGAPIGAVSGVDVVDTTTSAGADGGGSFAVTLSITDANAGLSTTAGAAISLYLEGDGTVTGRTGSSAGPVAFAISINNAGQVAVAQYLTLAHPQVSDHDDVLDLAGKLAAVVTQTDADGDLATDAVAIGAAIQFEDDGPTVSANAGVQLDDDALAGGNAGGTGDDTDAASTSGTLGFDPGADGLGTVAWLATGAPAGFNYVLNAGDLEVWQDSRHVLTLTLHAVTGAYGVTQLAPVRHAAGGAENNQQFAFDYRVTDADGDAAIGQLVVDVDDDAPTISARTDLVYANGSNPAPGGTGVFAYSIGADARSGPWTASNSDFASVTLASGTLAGYAISSMAVTWQSEDAGNAVFAVSFDYLSDPGLGTLAPGGGTLTFDKVAGTYHLSMADPFPLAPVLETAHSRGFTGYQLDDHATDKTQPLVSVATVSTQFYAQFTGIKEPGSGTGSNNLKAGSGAPNAFASGELFTQAATWVSVSNVATGVASDTIQKGEVLDMDFFTYNPHGFSSVAPDARIDGVFLKFDGIKRFGSSGEDFVVVLKLVNDSGGYTTRAVIVENGDIYNNTGPVPAPYAGIALDNNDGLVVIERNDYNGIGETWRIQGMQVLTSTEGVSGSGVNLNRAVGVAGGSAGTQSFDSVTNDSDVMKIASIGFLSSFTPDAHLHFDVAVQDADGDVTAAQRLDVALLGGSTFIAGTGQESLQGRIGQADTFVFGSVATSPFDAPDVITGFVSGQDRLDLIAIDAVDGGADSAFTWLDGAAFTGNAGELRFDAATEQLQADVDGDGAADFVVVLAGVAALLPADLML